MRSSSDDSSSSLSLDNNNASKGKDKQAEFVRDDGDNEGEEELDDRRRDHGSRRERD